ncbi:hypothetical protein [Polymorphobacter sp. PAMC 29334]|nr:hypothetical protein [Polymorphobacter sp. PAMC 29334]
MGTDPNGGNDAGIMTSSTDDAVDYVGRRLKTLDSVRYIAGRSA